MTRYKLHLDKESIRREQEAIDAYLWAALDKLASESEYMNEGRRETDSVGVGK